MIFALYVHKLWEDLDENAEAHYQFERELVADNTDGTSETLGSLFDKAQLAGVFEIEDDDGRIVKADADTFGDELMNEWVLVFHDDGHCMANDIGRASKRVNARRGIRVKWELEH